MLTALTGRGIERVVDFFEPDETGNLRVRDHQTVPVEASIALLWNWSPRLNPLECHLVARHNMLPVFDPVIERLVVPDDSRRH
jgi:hypothetical protein